LGRRALAAVAPVPCSRLGDARLLLIGTYRDVELGRHHPLSRVLGELSGSGEARVALHGLSEADVGHYIAMTGGGRAGAAAGRRGCTT